MSDKDAWMQAGTVILAILAVGGGLCLAVLGKPDPDWLGVFIGGVGGSFFALRASAVGGGAAGYGASAVLGNGHPGTTTVQRTTEPTH